MAPGSPVFGDAYRGKRVLVTGDTGFKGSWLCQWLLDLGATVGGYAIDIPTRPSLFEALGLEKKIAHRQGDIRDLAALKRAFDEFRPELVFHLAAQPLVRASYDDPKTTFDTNTGGTVNLLECVRASKTVKAAVLVASDKCYENLEAGHAYLETDRLGGHDPYSASKACAELVFAAYQRSFFSTGARLASARAGNIIGGGDWAADRVVPDCARAWSQGQPAQIRNPASTRPWQFVLEPLAGYLGLGARLSQSDAAVAGESFNFGPDASQTVTQLLAQMQKLWEGGRWETALADNDTKKEAATLRLDCEKANARLKWRALLSFERSVQLTVEWYRAFYEGKANMVELTQKQLREYEKLL